MSEWLRLITQVRAYDGRDVAQEKLGGASIAGGVHTCTAIMEINMWVPLKDGNLSQDPLRKSTRGVPLKDENLSQDPAIPLSATYPKDTSSYHKDTCSTIFIVSLFIIARKWR